MPNIQYTLTGRESDGRELINSDGLDATIIGTPNIPVTPIQYLRLGEGTYAQVAGESQRDECLGDLDLCPEGLTKSRTYYH